MATGRKEYPWEIIEVISSWNLNDNIHTLKIISYIIHTAMNESFVSFEYSKCYVKTVGSNVIIWVAAYIVMHYGLKCLIHCRLCLPRLPLGFMGYHKSSVSLIVNYLDFMSMLLISFIINSCQLLPSPQSLYTVDTIPHGENMVF